MINYNGTLITENDLKYPQIKRAFNYGDALFETVKIVEGKIQFLEDHYFRLMATMRILRMEIPLYVTMEFLEEQLVKTATANNIEDGRVRLTVFRNAEGLYTPKSNKTGFVIDAKEVTITEKENYVVEIFKDYTINPSLLSNLKTTNKIINVLSSIYAKENGLDNVILMNEQKNVVEFTNGNIFVVKGNTITTPPLSDGCVKGVYRKNLLAFFEKNKNDFSIEEKSISPFTVQKADAVFLTNVITGIQAITQYKKKQFSTEKVKQIQELVRDLAS